MKLSKEFKSTIKRNLIGYIPPRSSKEWKNEQDILKHARFYMLRLINNTFKKYDYEYITIKNVLDYIDEYKGGIDNAFKSVDLTVLLIIYVRIKNIKPTYVRIKNIKPTVNNAITFSIILALYDLFDSICLEFINKDLKQN